MYQKMLSTIIHSITIIVYKHVTCIINPRRACAARVTVVCLCVCVSATILALQATRRLMSDNNKLQCYKGKKSNVAIFLKRLRSRDMA